MIQRLGAPTAKQVAARAYKIESKLAVRVPAGEVGGAR
jgi:hypothetical protein